MITSEKEYEAIVTKIEELLTNPENIENPESKGFEELNRLSDLAVDYEEKSLLREELIKGEESGMSDKSMAEILEEAIKRAPKAQ
jgi:HTH-type transcriptional regulator/antitoxin HigA